MRGWEQALEQLDERGRVARAAARRMEELKVRPLSGTDTSIWLERVGQAVVISKVADADYLRAARSLMARHLTASAPPARLPRTLLPPRPMRAWWQEHLTSTSAGVWRLLPVPSPEAAVDGELASAAGLREAVRTAAARLQDSRSGQRARPDRMLEPVPGHPGALAVPEHRLAEHGQAHHDRFAVWERIRAYGDAVSAYLRQQHALPAAEHRSAGLGAARGIASFVGQEDRLAPHHRAPARTTLGREHWVAAGGWSLLGVALLTTAIQFGLASYWLIDHRWPAWLGLALAMALTVVTIRSGITRSWAHAGLRAVTPALAAAAAAVVLLQMTSPVLDHFYPSPTERYERELGGAGECLADTPYALGEVAIKGPGERSEALEIGSLTHDVPALRLGPASLGSTEPLRPLDERSAEILRQHGCI